MPLIEAFYKRVPVVAYAATAVPATMDGGGVLYDSTDPRRVAALIDARPVRTRRRRTRSCAAQDAALARLLGQDFSGIVVALRARRPGWSAPAAARGRGGFLAPVHAGRGARGDSADAARRRSARCPCRPTTRAGGRPGAPAMIVNQWVPAAHRGDAVGDNARGLRAICSRGWDTSRDIFALTIDDDLAGRRPPVARRRSRAQGDVTILHFAMPSPMTAAFGNAAGRARALLPQRHARRVLRAVRRRHRAPDRASAAANSATLVGRVDLAVGVSEYNRRELE